MKLRVNVPFLLPLIFNHLVSFGTLCFLGTISGLGTKA